MQAVAKARTFYFDEFLSPIVPCMLIRTSSSHNGYTNYHVNKNIKVYKERETFICTGTPSTI